MALVKLSEHQRQEYLLLSPTHCPPRTGSNFNLINPTESFRDIIASIMQSPIVAVDFETRGNDYSRTGPANKLNEDYFQVVGIGFAWDEGNCYFDITPDSPPSSRLSPEEKLAIRSILQNHPGLIAHNVYFDGGTAKQCLDVSPNWLYCTYSLYSYLANEGFAGRGWGLKTAQTELLLWESSNEKELDEWLVVNGYYTGNRRLDSSEEYLRNEYITGGLKPNKAEMWRAPVHILGKYCILDAESTYLLFCNVLRPTLSLFPNLDSFIRDHWMGLIDTLIDQKIHGILMDRPGLVERKNTLTAQISKLTHDFRHHPEVHKHILAMEHDMALTYLEKQPARFNKDGITVSKNWIKWYAKMDLINGKHVEEYLFNMQSGPQLRELLYTRLGYEVKVLSEKGEPSVAVKALQSLERMNESSTESGGIGAILTERVGLVKELGYIEKYLELTEDRPTIHPSFRTPGTTTGRLSSKEPNLQQVSKTKDMMSLFKARPGKVWVDLDFCLHPDTEYLTLRGWIKVSNLTDQDHVWTVNPDTLIGHWEIPSRIIRRHYEGPMHLIGNRRGKLAVTENHRMLWTNQTTRGRKYRHVTTYSQQGIPNTAMSTVQTSSHTPHGGYVPTDHELAMVCLLQADSYKTKTKGYTVQVSLPRKRKRVQELLGEEKCSQTYPPHGTQRLEVESWSNIRYTSPLLKGKSLDLSNLCSSVGDKLVNELLFWDGSLGRSGEIIYSSTDKQTIDSIQSYLVRCSYECKLKGRQPKYPGSKYFYTLTIRPTKGIRLRKGIDDVHTYNYIGEVGCVTVSTGYIQVRYNGQTFITGNCALEPVVVTEYSQDENMMKIYGDGRPANDIYCFVMAHIPGMEDRARALGFDPDSPTKESLARVKKEMKKERGICKTVVLAAQYGAGVNKIKQILEEQEIFLPHDQVQNIYEGYWELFAQVKDFARALHFERKRNKGYILNGLGRPMAIPEEFEKDILNRFIQSTGHDVLTIYISILKKNLAQAGIKWDPIVIDWHDSTGIEVAEEDRERTIKCFMDAMDQLNAQLQGTIKLKGTPSWGYNLADTKEPEE